METLEPMISISTRVSGIPALVRHKEIGCLVPRRDAAAIADAIAFPTSDPALRARLAHSGRALVESELSIEGSTSRLAKLFHECV